MAEEGGGDDVKNTGLNQTQDDVFVNGENDSKASNLLVPDNASKQNQVIPRRSSLVKDSSRRPIRKKTVSFSSMPNEKKVVNAPDCLNCMQNGSELIKVRSNSRQYHRLFSLNADCTEIRWHPSSKKASKARIPISEIKEVRVGKNTDVLRNKDIGVHYAEECAFSIIYSEEYESMDLIANTPDEANIWVTGLTCLISKNKGASETLEERQQLRDQWLLGMFETADTTNSGLIDERQVVSLVKKLNTGLTTTKIQQKLKELAISKEGERGRLTSSEFISLFKEIATRPEIYFLLVRYASSMDFLTVDDLALFLEAEQGMTRVSKGRCMEIINQHEPSSEGRKLGQLGIDGFTAFLLSEECDIFDVAHKNVIQDMTQPLSHYFIASSHNTYLLEDQLKGPSSTEGYIRALTKAARYIELDVWDGPDDEPIVWHGHTLTSKVPFKAVIEAINQFAFKASPYPVILSIQNHSSFTQQQYAAKCLVTTLGDKLHTQTIDSSCQHLPSPEQLKGKILIKGKKLDSSEINKDVINEEEEGYVTEEDEAEADRRSRSNKREGNFKRIKLSRDLSDLVTYCRSTRFMDFQTSMRKQKCFELCSFSESLALKLSTTCPADFVTYNKSFLSKVYPNGMRVDSSNFNPQDLWNSGCQIVALNYQTAGLMMDLNDGRFLANGGCGFVLKPSVMRDDISCFSANTRDVIPGVSPQILHIKVISGQNLPKPKGAGARGNTIDPYVAVEIFGIPADCAEERTKTVQHDGYNPIFDESFEFQVNLPDLALVRFVVLDDDYIGDEFIGQYTIPFECIQTGYRHIRLKSNNGEVIPNCTLFVHIAITNKAGGGKTTRKRMSVGKSKRRSSNSNLKTVGIKAIDDSFKEPLTPLRRSVDLRDGVHKALSAFKEACGLAECSNIKQCIRTLACRVQMSSDTTSLHLDVKDDLPYLEAGGAVPETLKKAFTAFDAFVSECKQLMENSDEVQEKLLSGQQGALSVQEELPSLAQQQNVKGKKLNKAIENYAWNIRLLKGQADLMAQAQRECQEYLQQAKEAGYSLGIMSEESDSSGACGSPVFDIAPNSFTEGLTTDEANS